MYQIELQNKEHIIYWMLQHGNVRLSHYDHSFLSSMMQLVHERKNITENQSNLLTRLITKYQHQLSQSGFQQPYLHSLKWKSKIIPSLPEFTRARLSYNKEENLLVFKVPFKKDFINDFRRIMLGVLENYHYPDDTIWKWNKEKKRYEAPASTHALKIAYKVLPKYFETIYQGEVKEVIEQLEAMEKQTWDPTLVENDGVYSIAGSNDSLDSIFKDVNLNTEPKTLANLAYHGVAIDSNITNEVPRLEFFAQYAPEVDIDHLEDFVSWLKEIDCKTVVVTRGLNLDNTDRVRHRQIDITTIAKEIRRVFDENDIEIINGGKSNLLNDAKDITKEMVLLRYSSTKEQPQIVGGAIKNIQIINRRPIDIV
tara:strand:+ start:742 stop:1845 length:1104 start_codon:yes stop_codon:yes gene_type:complete